MKKNSGYSDPGALNEHESAYGFHGENAAFLASENAELERRVTQPDAEQAKRLAKAKKRKHKAISSLTPFTSDTNRRRQLKLKKMTMGDKAKAQEGKSLGELFGEEITLATVSSAKAKVRQEPRHSLLDISFADMQNRHAVKAYLLSFLIFFLLVSAGLIFTYQTWGRGIENPLPDKEPGNKLNDAQIHGGQNQGAVLHPDSSDQASSDAENPDIPARSIKHYYQSLKRFPPQSSAATELAQPSPTPSPSPTTAWAVVTEPSTTPSTLTPTVSETSATTATTATTVPTTATTVPTTETSSTSSTVTEPSPTPTPTTMPSSEPSTAPSTAPSPSPTPVPTSSETTATSPAPTPTPEPSTQPSTDPSPTPLPSTTAATEATTIGTETMTELTSAGTAVPGE